MTDIKLEENFEEGEIKVIDEENYILSDSYFNFQFDEE